MRRELIIEGYTIELMEADIVSVTKSIVDISDPNVRNSNFTKTIKLPYSRVNNQVFSAHFEAGFTFSNTNQFEPFYNPSKKAKAAYYEDTLTIIEGYVKLNSITNIYGEIFYELTITGENKDLFSTIEGKKLSELDLSKYDHIYNLTNVENSWNGDIYVNGVLTSVGSGSGDGYLYPSVNYGGHAEFWNGTFAERDYWRLQDYKLWIKCNTIWDAIFDESGYKYKSDFIDSIRFKRLILSGSDYGLRRDDSDIDQSKIYYTNNGIGTTFTLTSNTNGLNLYNTSFLVFDILVQDNNSDYNSTTGVLQVGTSKDYDFYLELNITATALVTTGANIFGAVQLIDDLGNILFSSSIQRVINSSVTIGGTVSFQVVFSKLNIVLDSARQYKTCIVNTNTSWNYLINNSTLVAQLNANIGEGDLIEVSKFLHPDMNQKDFILGIAKMFNLYIEPYYYYEGETESGAYRTYLIEPRDDYYTSDVIDISKDIDRSQEFVIKPIAAAANKFNRYSYLEDDDYFNKLYKQMTGRVYGDVIIDIENDFLSGTKEVKIPFSLPVLVRDYDSELQQGRIMTYDTGSEFNEFRNGKSKPKIAYNNTELACDTYLQDTTYISTYNPATQYLSLNNNFAVDLAFDNPEKLFYTTNQGQVYKSNKGLFNLYHCRDIFETNNKNSKIVECYVRMTPYMIATWSFRKIYQIDNVNYRLYKIEDYKYGEVTKCIFLRLVNTTPPAEEVVSTNGGKGEGNGIGVGGGNNPITEKIIDVKKGYNNGDLKTGNNQLIGGVMQIPTLGNQLVSIAMNYTNITESLILSGAEGSPYYIYVGTLTSNISINLPDETKNYGKTYIVVKENGAHTITIKDFADTTVDTITSIGAKEYQLTI